MRLKILVAWAFIVFALAVHPSSQTSQTQSTSSPAVTGQIIVTFRPGTAAGDRANAHQQSAGVRLDDIPQIGVELVAVAAGSEVASAARYLRNPNVLYAEPNFIRSVPEPLADAAASPIVPGDTYFDEEYGLHNTGQMFQCFPWIFGELCYYVGTPDADIDAPEAWAISQGSPNVKVAIIDTGIDYNHPDLAANYAGGWNFLNNDPDPMDDHGHGTHVAGTVAAAMNNPTGNPGQEEGVVGVAPGARILSYKVCGPDGTCSDFAIEQAIARAVTDGARVISMSLGDAAYSSSLNLSVQNAWNAGLVIVAAAGNNGDTTLFYPAALDHVISVGAFDEDHRRASFSTYGSWVDISAPGNAIMSSYPLASCGGLGTTPGDTGCYTWMSGTSMATPHVSGAAALVWSRGDVSTNSQVVDILLQSADPRGVDTVRLDSWTIHGGLNIHDALSYAVANQAPVASAGPDQTVTDTDGNGSEPVVLDGSGSTDADGSIVAYEWREGTTVLSTGSMPTVNLAVGAHTLTLDVTDNAGATGTDTVVITVQAPGTATDTVHILKATYNGRKLSVEATSTAAPNAELTAWANNSEFVGTLVYSSRKRTYAGSFTRATAPETVAVSSDRGGWDSLAVAVK